MKKVLTISVILILILSGCLYTYMFKKAGDLLYWGHSYEYWISKHKIRCNSWHLKTAYADLREGHDSSKPLEVDCSEGIKWPAQEFNAKTSTGANIVYRVYDNPVLGHAYKEFSKPRPLLLYVHGITGNYADGIRYYHLASRMGFQLVLMELSNHGMSDNNGLGAAYGCREHLDVQAVFQDLISRFPDREMMIYTTSMGAMSVSNASPALMKLDKNHQLISVVLESPIPSIKSVIMKNKEKPPAPEFMIDMMISIAGTRAGVDFFQCAPENSLSALKVPTLVQTTATDRMVTQAMAQRVFDALPDGISHHFKSYPGGKHSAIWNGHPQEVEQDMMNIWTVGLKFKEEKIGS